MILDFQLSYMKSFKISHIMHVTNPTINWLKSEYSIFMIAIQDWRTQPTLLELENMLANQEALAKQMTGVSLK
jgi:hypothetical protein